MINETQRSPKVSLDLEALETSFDLVAPRGDELMDDFYARLFAAAPAVKPLFPNDMKKQKTMLLGALVLLRKSLRNLDAIVPKLRELGARHVGVRRKARALRRRRRHAHHVPGRDRRRRLAARARDGVERRVRNRRRDDARGSGAGGARSGRLRSVRRAR